MQGGSSTKGCKRASKAVSAAQHACGCAATRELIENSCQVTVGLVRLAHAHKLLHKACKYANKP